MQNSSVLILNGANMLVDDTFLSIIFLYRANSYVAACSDLSMLTF